MFQQHIDGMIDALVKACLISKAELVVGRARDILNNYWSDKAAIVWGVDDVLERANDMGYDITRSDASCILGSVVKDHDAAVGVNWAVVMDSIGEYCYKKKIARTKRNDVETVQAGV